MKQRIDLWLVDQGYFQSREQAQRAIMAGEVAFNGKRIEKAGQMVEVGGPGEITVAGPESSYVSRGGYKLEKALAVFKVMVAGKVCLDAGASTGGFTDCLLQAGAAHVYAVDVGYGQLAWKLRQDSRVTVFERENIRYFEAERLAQKPQLITADLSFISLKLIFPKFSEFIADHGNLITLIKPQFEAGKGKVGKKGVVRDRAVHEEVLNQLTGEATEAGWYLQCLTFSPILGPEGNIEYLGHWIPVDRDNPVRPSSPDTILLITRAVDAAWAELK